LEVVGELAFVLQWFRMEQIVNLKGEIFRALPRNKLSAIDNNNCLKIAVSLDNTT